MRDPDWSGELLTRLSEGWCPLPGHPRLRVEHDLAICPVCSQPGVTVVWSIHPVPFGDGSLVRLMAIGPTTKRGWQWVFRGRLACSDGHTEALLRRGIEVVTAPG